MLWTFWRTTLSNEWEVINLEYVPRTHSGLATLQSVALLAIGERKSNSIPSNILWTTHVLLYIQMNTIISLSLSLCLSLSLSLSHTHTHTHTHTEGLGSWPKMDQSSHFSNQAPQTPWSSNEHVTQCASTRILSQAFIREICGKWISFLFVLDSKNKKPQAPTVLVHRDNRTGRIKSILRENLNLLDFKGVLLTLLKPCLYSSIPTVCQ